MRTSILSASLLIALSGCIVTTTSTTSGGSDDTSGGSGPPTAHVHGAQACTSSADCAEGQSCQGEQGCDTPWTCQPSRQCTLDLVPYCGCDGETFRGSSSCPPRPYTARGSCPEEPQQPPPPTDTTEQPTDPPTGTTDPPTGTTGPEDGPPPPSGTVTTCTTSDDCPQGQMCSGDAGCPGRWTCQPARPCTRDLVPFCGCDGQTFRGSSSCPRQPYSARGACQSQ